MLDEYGYPTEHILHFIENYVPDDSLPILSFLSVIKDIWQGGFKLGRKYKGRCKLELHTEGWSGNEQIINSIISNIYLTGFKMRYVKWITGGHYYFEIRD